jgi:hypothetical protein
MKKLLAIIVLGLLFSGNASSEILKIDCTLKFNDGQIIPNYFELNSETDIYYNDFEGDQVFWTTVTEMSKKEWMPIYHHVNRRSGVYTAGFGVATSTFPEKGDPMVELFEEKFGTCQTATSKRKF